MKALKVLSSLWVLVNVCALHKSAESQGNLSEHLQEEWNGHNEEVSPVYSDDHVAFYFGKEMDTTLFSSFKQISNAWKYCKENYGPFPQDPRLFLILHQHWRVGCQSLKLNSSSNGNSTLSYSTIVDCRTIHKDWKRYDVVENIMQEIGKITLERRFQKDIGYWPAQEVAFTYISSILVYDIYNSIGMNSTAHKFSKRFFPEEYNFPRISASWFHGWYLPIYNKYGKASVLNSFFANLDQHWRGNKSGQMNIGEFVHFWSGAAGEDLWEVAYHALGWTSEDQAQLDEARNRFPELSSLYTMKSLSPPPLILSEKWESHSERIALTYIDDHVVFYFDANVRPSITWPFKLMSAAWNYTKQTYGPFGLDPMLYIVLHGKNKEGCIVPKTYDSIYAGYENRKVIDCGIIYHNDLNPWERRWENANRLIRHMGEIVLNFAKETSRWPANSVSQRAAAHAFTLDILLQLDETDYPKEWVNMSMKKILNDPFSGNWFRDWWLPLYEKYGRSQFLNRFLTNVYDNWPRNGQYYVGSMGVGDLLHFCNGATGVSLWNEIKKKTGWKLQYHEQYLQARDKYPHFNYTDEVPPRRWIEDWEPNGPYSKHERELKLVYIDTNIAAYFDSRVDESAAWPFKELSDAWKYVQDTFGPFGQDPYLYFVFHEGLNPFCAVNNRYENLNGKTIVQNRTIVDCSKDGNWYFEDTWTPDMLMEMVAMTAFRGSIVDKNWIKYSRSYHPDGWVLHRLLIFDIYMGIGRTEDGVRYLRQNLRDGRFLYPKRDDFWFRKWYYPIYAQYGKTLVFIKLGKLLRMHWPRSSAWDDYAPDMNVGEFVHFWSGAAGMDLGSFAKQALALDETEEKQLVKARIEFPMVTYKDYSPPEFPRPLLLEDSWFGNEELLFFIRANSHVTLYTDAYIKPSITWPFQFITDSWNNAIETYSLVRKNSTLLYAILRGKTTSSCRGIWNEIQKVERQEVINVIDCGQNSRKIDVWEEESGRNKDLIIVGFANLIQKSANQTRAHSAYYYFAMENMITFDQYLRMGELEEAYKRLKISFNNGEIHSAGTIFWFRDWYLSIYTNFGGVAVIDNLLSLLAFNWPLKKCGEIRLRLNIGELVHFWSTAANVSVVDIAQDVLGWTQRTLDQFLEARNVLPHFKYLCYDCGLPKEVKSTSWAVITTSMFIAFGITFVLIGLITYKMKVEKLRKQIRDLTAEEVKEFYEGNTNAASTPESAPFNKEFEISKEQLDINYHQILGSGEFGLVLRGKIKIPYENEIKVIEVAVKTVKSDVEITEFKVLMSELKVLAFLGRHECVASLVGAVTTNIRNRELYLALEFCAKGDLLANLRKHRDKFLDLFHDKEINAVNENYENTLETPADYVQLEEFSNNPNAILSNRVTTADLVKWAIEISVGMDYIGSKNVIPKYFHRVIHGDLAARNVLLTAENHAKISDFGLSRQLANYSKYTKKSKTPLPWRWMAIESLRDLEFSVKSDVWAFGVTLFEIFTLGAVPFSHCKWSNEFVNNVSAGLRLNAPDFGNNDIFHLMMDCMRAKPEQRISFKEIANKLEKIKVELC